MPAQTSTYLRQFVLEHVLMGENHPSPTNLYLGLFVEDPTPENTGTEVNPTGTNYERQEISWALNGGSGRAENAITVDFPAATSEWGIVTHWGVFDDETGGNLLYFGAADLARDTIGGIQITVPESSLKIDPSGLDA